MVCRWLPDGQNFISGGGNGITVRNLRGTVIHQWNSDHLLDLALTPDGSRMVCVDKKRKLLVYSIKDGFRELNQCQMSYTMSSISVSKDSKYVLLSSLAPEVLLLDIEELKCLRSFKGRANRISMIRSCFGGPEENFVLSGSEGIQYYKK